MPDSTQQGAISMFDAHAPDYAATRRRLVPSFDQFYGTAVEALGLIGRPPARVLDLGAGTGLFAGAVAEVYADAELVLLDGSPAMLEQAKGLLGARASYITSRLEEPLPAGPWDAVVSALAAQLTSVEALEGGQDPTLRVATGAPRTGAGSERCRVGERARADARRSPGHRRGSARMAA